MKLLNNNEIEVQLQKVNNWILLDKAIEKNFQFKDFKEAMLFVNAIAEIAETLAHHPDIKIVWNKVNLVISTHDKGGLTEKDFQLASQIDIINDK